MNRFIFLFMLSVCVSNAQIKNEFERKIGKEEIPESTRFKLENGFTENVKIKWFYQEDGDKKVYEAKFKYNANVYSVEFDLNGKISNVEILTSKNNIPSDVFNVIDNEIHKEFSEYRILKIQKEFIGASEDLFDVIHSSTFSSNLAIDYEIEVNVKQNKRRHLYELIFDEKGNLTSKRKINLKSTDILDY